MTEEQEDSGRSSKVSESYVFSAEDGPASLHDYFRIVRKRLWLILVFAGVGIIAAGLTLSNTKRAYLASGRLLFIVPSAQYSRGASTVTSVDYSGLGDPEWGAYMPTQMELLRSRALAEAVAAKLSLSEKWEFEPESAGLLARAIAKVRSLGRKKIETTATKTEPASPAEPDYAAAISARIGVKRVEDSRIVEVSFVGKDPAKITRILDLVMETFIEQDFERRYKSAREVLEWLRGQQRDLQTAIESCETNLQDYVEKEKLAMAPNSEGDRDTVDAQKLDALGEAIIAASAKRIQAQTLYEHLQKDGNLQEGMPQITGDEGVGKLMAERALLESRKKALGEKFGGKWPAMQEVESQLAAVNQQIEQERQKLLASAKAAFEVAREQETRLKAALEEQKQRTIAQKRKGLTYRMLRREIQANEKMFDMLLTSGKEASVAEKIDRNQVGIEDRARLVGEVSSKKAKAMSVGIVFMAALAGLGLAFMLEQSNPCIETEDEVENLLRIPLLGSVARLSKEAVERNGRALPLVTKLEPHSVFAEQIRGLGVNATAQVFDRKQKTLLVTSTVPREGKTLLAANLAVCLAQLGKEVLLVDSDMRKSTVHKVFGLENNAGFAEICRQEGFDILSVIQPSGVPNLWILPAGRRPSGDGAAFSLHADSLRWLLAVVSNRFDAVVLDSAPLGVIADGLDLAKIVDAVLLVFRSGVVTRRMAQRTIRQISNVGANLIGAALNDVHKHGLGYRGYYYYPYRYRGYHDYYTEPDRRGEAQTQDPAQGKHENDS